MTETPDWRTHGLRIIRSGELDSNTPQTPGMTYPLRSDLLCPSRRAEAVGRNRRRPSQRQDRSPSSRRTPNPAAAPGGGTPGFTGKCFEFVDEAGPGDFVYVPPYVPHQELNARKDEPVEAVIVRSGQEPIVVNLDIPSPEDAPDSPVNGSLPLRSGKALMFEARLRHLL